MLDLTDADILARLTNSEDSTSERKTANDYRDCLKTAVAFSNSLPIDDPGIIFIGVYDDGRVEDNKNLDSLQKKVSEEINKIYPPIYPQTKVMMQNGKEFLAVIVRGSENRPHFAGPSYVRQASQTLKASEPQFSNLISQRTRKAYEILKWKDREITLQFPPTEFTLHATSQRRPGERIDAIVEECNQFYLTLQFKRQATDKTKYSYPLNFLEISFDDAKAQLEIILTRHLH